jgi:hypothetical protein
MQDRLPKLAYSLFKTFIGEVHAATSTLRRPDDGPAKYAEKVEFQSQLKSQEPELDAMCCEVTALYTLIADCGIRIPDLEAAEIASMDNDYHSLKDAVAEVDSMKDDMVQVQTPYIQNCSCCTM